MRCMCALVGSVFVWSAFHCRTLCSFTMWMQSKTYINFPWCFISVIKGHCAELQPRGVLPYNSTFLVSFFFHSSLPRYCGHCKKQRVKVCRETACSVYTKPHSKHWTYGSEHMVIAKLLSRKHKCVIPKYPLCWRNVISEYTGICTLQRVSRWDYFRISWNQGKSFIIKLNYSLIKLFSFLWVFLLVFNAKTIGKLKIIITNICPFHSFWGIKSENKVNRAGYKKCNVNITLHITDKHIQIINVNRSVA